MRRVLIGLGVAAAIVAGVLWAFRGPIAMSLMERTVARNMSADPIAALPEGLHVGVCGAGGPMAGARGGPCITVIAGTRMFVVDAGSGAARHLFQMQLPPDHAEAVFLTHFHSDHLDGLGELGLLRWAGGGHASPLPVYGPTGVERVAAGFNEAYALDATYRIAHHGSDVVPPSGTGLEARAFEKPAPGEAVMLIDEGGLTVRAFAVNHDPAKPAVGYRFDYKGRSVTISGDTKKSENLQHFAEGTDILLHEGLDPELVKLLENGANAAGNTRLAKVMVDILDYHTTPEEAAEVAQAAGTGELVYYHVVPPLPLGALESVFLDGVSDAYDGPVTVANDGDFWSLPPDEGRAERSSRL